MKDFIKLLALLEGIGLLEGIVLSSTAIIHFALSFTSIKFPLIVYPVVIFVMLIFNSCVFGLYYLTNEMDDE
jgi:hypothetical protein